MSTNARGRRWPQLTSRWFAGRLAGALALVAACSGAESPQRRAAAPAAPAAGVAADAASKLEGVTRWLGSRPRLPLVGTTREGFVAVEPGMCGAWMEEGSEWLALDRMGQVHGRFRLGARRDSPGSQCPERALEVLEGNADGIAVHADDGWFARPSPAWTPRPGQRAGLQAVVEQQDRKLVDPAQYSVKMDALPFEERVVFARLGGAQGECAIVGGPYLAIACVGGDSGDVWLVRFLDFRLTNRGGHARSYRVVAVVSMNAGESPQIVVQIDDGPSWADHVYSVGPDGTWWDVAEGLPAGTI